MRIWIRVDGNDQIASGHLRRCFTIAESLAGLGASPAFLLAGKESEKMYQTIAEREGSFPYSVINVPYGRPMEEIPALERCRGTPELQSPDWMLVDSYAVTRDYFEALYGSFPGVKIAFLDDMMRFDPDVDLVVNYDPDIGELLKFYHKARVRLLGPSYVPLRRQFQQFRENESGISGQRRSFAQKGTFRVLISTGGTDPYHMAGILADVVHSLGEEFKEAGTLHAEVIAPGYPYVSDMAGLMRGCDLAVSAAGTTLYELCAAGVPSISFSMADNQKSFAEKMAVAGLISYAGDVREEDAREIVLQRVNGWLTGQIPSPRLRAEQSRRMRGAVDGQGADRIAGAMVHVRKQEFDKRCR